MRVTVQERPTRGNRRRVEAGDGSLSSLGGAGVGGGMGHEGVESSGEVRV
jgi:hypothetical protein